ncbi:hypothetical protein I3760_06G011800 [Carya illinoinensis]|nr:hypothetical protein I3760_06G011800 [Carya illinoinensis]
MAGDMEESYNFSLQEVSEVNHYAHFDESPEGSAYQGEYLTACKMENLKVLFPVPQMESASNRADVLVDGVAEDVNAEEIHQTEAGCDEILLVKAESDINGREIFLSVNEEPEMDVNHNLDDDAVNADESFKAMVKDKSVNGDLLQKGIDPAPKNCSSH